MTVDSPRDQSAAVVIFILALGVLSGCSEPQNTEPAEHYRASSPLRTRLLTADQYTASIAQVFGEDIADSVLPPIPPMAARTDGLLASGAAFVGVTSDQVSQISRQPRQLRLRWSIKSIAIF